MASEAKKKKGAFFSRAIAFYIPGPGVAGNSYDVDAIFNGVDSIGRALQDNCGCVFNYHDNVDCESFVNLTNDFIKTCGKSKTDQAVVYICTHGFVNPGTGELHLMMDDSKDPKKDQCGFYKTSISGPQLRECIGQLQKAVPDGQVLVLLDCCNAGALCKQRQAQTLGLSEFAFANVRNHPARPYVQGKGCVVFMSSGPDRDSLIDGNLNISEDLRCPLFTKAVAQTLNEFPGEPIHLAKLVKSVKEKVAKWSGGTQHPFEFPPLWSEAAAGIRYVGFGHAVPQDMEVDERYQHILCAAQTFPGEGGGYLIDNTSLTVLLLYPLTQMNKILSAELQWHLKRIFLSLFGLIEHVLFS